MLIVHLSDLHIFADVPETPKVRRDIAAVVARIVDDILSLPQRPDAVAITGDLTDGGSHADYALARRLLAALPMPLFVVPGNHDRREAMRAAFGDRVPFAQGEFLHFAARLGDLRILGLDSVIPGRTEGELCPARLDWLARQLATDTTPTLLLLHHPPFPSGNAFLDAGNLLRGGTELERLLARTPAECRLLCGHVHRPMHTQWAGGYAAIGGSPASHYALDLGEREPALIETPYAYALHHWRPDGGWTVYPRHLPQP
ncbi:serine/threonine protein phosphatase [Halomonas sp. MCCC 1A11036]|uniref:Serine/threonine protein phosphatase n=1 Tax=Billgrantia zhangzhouensis TaxID=2733481 RepID=A0ABS9AFU9_9GAMM|nr:metallophosphoesterase [Halomonas zhangzhouensis]MCE8020628.1 serine/threonine protein phosphatase [Halomonas zhangzhouensis]